MPNQEVQSIDVASIEKELTVLWKEAEDGDESSPVIRACSLNLLVLGGDDPETGEILDALSVEHPARTFLISTDGDHPSASLEAWVAARCSIPLPGEKQVCCEQIHLRGNMNAGGRIASVVTSLLVPDIPVVLWRRTTAGIPEDLFGSLKHLCDFIIFDSANDMQPGAALQLPHNDEPSLFGDLAWERTEPWRQLFANIFDSPAARTELEDLAGIRIVYAEQTNFPMSGFPSALLFAGWLCHTLDLQGERVFGTTKQGEIDANVTMGDKPVRISISGERRAQQKSDPFCSIVIEFKNADYILSVNEAGQCFRFVRKSRGNESRESWIPLRLPGEMEMLSRLLVVLDSDQVYRKSLLALTKKLAASV